MSPNKARANEVEKNACYER